MKRLIMVILILITFMSVGSTRVTAQENPCAKALPPHIKIGDKVQISKPTTQDLPGAFLKAQPGHPGPVMRYLPVGTVVEVTDGPKCGDDGAYWWNIKLGPLAGWIAETVGKDYGLEPAPATATSDALPSTVTIGLQCIKAPTPATPQPTTDPGMLRVAYGTFDGKLMVSDNGASGRQMSQFDPAPLSVDLSPDGASALVVTYNGLYWVDLTTGRTVLVADNSIFGLEEAMWVSNALWLPDGRIAIEITDERADTTAYQLWLFSLDGKSGVFRSDTGSQPHDSIQRSPLRKQAVVVTANDISPFPANVNDSPPSLLDYIPKVGEGSADQAVIPSLSWDAENKGFYTFIPLSDEAGPDDITGGHLWYVAMATGTATDLGQLPKIKSSDYVIVSPNGKSIILGHGNQWEIRSTESGAILQTLPPTQYLFTWTPDSSGVVFTDQTGQAKFLGIDGGTSSPYVPSVTNLYDIKWLADGTTMFAAKGKDGKLSFSVQRPNADAKFLGITATVNSVSAALLATKPGPATVPESCLAGATPPPATQAATQAAQ